jgi:hypothetical protein
MKRSIPPFNRFGLLPDGIHPCTEGDFRKRFVEDFPESSSRPAIVRGFSKLREDAASYGISAIEWVDGSFVENREPRDVDVVHFVDFDLAESLNAEAQEFIAEVLAAGEVAKRDYHTHSFFVPACGPDHEMYETFERLRQYWRKWFGTTRPRKTSSGRTLSGRKKGIIQLNLGNEQDLPAISPEEATRG